MKFKVTTLEVDGNPTSPVEVLLEMAALDWYVLKNSRQWLEVEQLLDNLQKLYTR